MMDIFRIKNIIRKSEKFLIWGNWFLDEIVKKIRPYFRILNFTHPRPFYLMTEIILWFHFLFHVTRVPLFPLIFGRLSLIFYFWIAILFFSLFLANLILFLICVLFIQLRICLHSFMRKIIIFN